MSDREAFEKLYPVPNATEFNKQCNEYRYIDFKSVNAPHNEKWEVWQAAQAQASKPIAAVHGWFHGECVIRALDPEAVLPVGMALYSQPQAQAGDGEAPVAWLKPAHELVENSIPDVVTTELRSATIARGGMAASCMENYSVPLYTAPPAAAVNQQQLPSGSVAVSLDDLQQLIEWYSGRQSERLISDNSARLIDRIDAAIAAAQEQSK